MSEACSTRKRKRHPFFCDRCIRFVPHTTFYHHKAKYYESASKTWDSCTATVDTDSSDSEVEIAIESNPVQSCNAVDFEEFDITEDSK